MVLNFVVILLFGSVFWIVWMWIVIELWRWNVCCIDSFSFEVLIVMGVLFWLIVSCYVCVLLSVVRCLVRFCSLIFSLWDIMRWCISFVFWWVNLVCCVVWFGLCYLRLMLKFVDLIVWVNVWMVFVSCGLFLWICLIKVRVVGVLIGEVRLVRVGGLVVEWVVSGRLVLLFFCMIMRCVMIFGGLGVLCSLEMMSLKRVLGFGWLFVVLGLVWLLVFRLIECVVVIRFRVFLKYLFMNWCCVWLKIVMLLFLFSSLVFGSDLGISLNMRLLGVGVVVILSWVSVISLLGSGFWLFWILCWVVFMVVMRCWSWVSIFVVVFRCVEWLWMFVL